jgi:hypothetical protein
MSDIRKITLQFPSLRAFLAEYGERIADDGMLLRCDSPPADGSTVEVEVVVAEGMRLVRARGEVLWSEAGEAGGGPGAAALRFHEIDDAGRTVIGKIVEQRRREGAELFDLDDVPGPREADVHDLMVPTAGVSVPPPPAAGADEGSLFELGQPPQAAASDLSSPPVPLLADPEPAPQFADLDPKPLAADLEPGPSVPPPADSAAAPFDLPPEPAVDEGEIGDASSPLEPTPPVDGDPGATAQFDLGDLFGGDEPLGAPARGRTEAFPPSFLDEVEAELKAADDSASATSREELGESEIPLGLAVEEPGTLPAAAPLASGAAADGEMEAEPAAEPAPEAAPLIEPQAAPETRPESGRDAAPAVVPVPEDEPPAEQEPLPEVQPAGELEPRAEIEPAVELEPATEPELVIEPMAELEPEPEAAVEPAVEVPRSPEVEPELELPTSSEPPLPVEPAEQGPETVEIPVVPRRAVAGPVRPAVTAPESPSAPPIDDNLLTIPEVGVVHAPAPAPDAPAETADLPSSAQSLRGAASSSRHLGTWLLIALLAAALGVAGYFLLGLVRGDGDAAPAELPAGGPAPGPGPSAGTAPTAGAGTTDLTEAGTAPQAAEETAAAEPTAAGGDAVAAATEPADPGEAVPAETIPAAPLTGLSRITWSESGDETVLTLVADGELSSQQVELVPITGGAPRLVIKIRGVERPFQPAVLEVATSHVLRVRTGLHAGGELHVVVDLAAPGVSVGDLTARGSRLEVRLGGQ